MATNKIKNLKLDSKSLNKLYKLYKKEVGKDKATALWNQVIMNIESLIEKAKQEALNTDKITRLEVIDYTKDVLDDSRRAYFNWDKDNKIDLSFQDDNRTLKIFIQTVKK